MVRESAANRYLVLPRGINVGRHNRVPMAELRSYLAAEGYGDVATVLASGNVMVSSEAESSEEVEEDMERLLSDRFDVGVRCLVRTADQVRAVFEANPLGEIATHPSWYLVNFLSEEPDGDLTSKLLAEDHVPEVLAIEGREAYVWTPDGVRGLSLSYARLEKRLGVVATARNWNTIAKIMAKL